MGGVNEDHSRNLTWVLTGVNPDVVSAHGVSHQNVRTSFTGRPQQLLQFACNLQAAAWFGTGVAPAISGAIVGTHSRELRDLWLHPEPVNGGPARTALQYYSGRSLPAAVNVHANGPDLDEVAAPREALCVTPPSDHFVERSGDRQ